MKKAQTGFTLVEMMAALSIMAIITTTLFVSYPKLGHRLAVEREAQLVALMLRDAEERAIRTRRVGSAFSAPFGVHFDLSSPRQYVLFADLGGTSGYFDEGIDEKIDTVVMGNGVSLEKLCAYEKQGLGVCLIQSLSITFRRPAPLIKVRGVIGGGIVLDLGDPDFEIYVRTDDGSFRRLVVVWTTGAISIEDVPSP